MCLLPFSLELEILHSLFCFLSSCIQLILEARDTHYQYRKLIRFDGEGFSIGSHVLVGNMLGMFSVLN